MKTLKFTKMHGLGNDFMVVNGIGQDFDPLTHLPGRQGHTLTAYGGISIKKKAKCCIYMYDPTYKK